MNKNSKMLDLLVNMGAYHRSDATPTVLSMYATDLEKFSVQAISLAWKKYRENPKNIFMPTPAQLVAHIDDGRPDANEAWAMIPWEEGPSVVWTEEIRMAFGAAEPLHREGQKQSAFFAFKEVYERLVMDARRNNIKPKWVISYGQDTYGRESAINEALAKKRITNEDAKAMMPERQIGYLEKLSLESESFKQESSEKLKAKGNLLKDLIAAITSGNQEQIDKIKTKAEEISNG